MSNTSAGRHARALLLAAPALLAASLFFFSAAARAQVAGGGHTLYGDFTVDESRAQGMVPISFQLILYTESGVVIERQSVGINSRFRFINLRNGMYDIAVEVEGREVTRTRVNISSLYKNDFRQDIALAWTAPAGGPRPGTVDASAVYQRSSTNQGLFERADLAAGRKDFAEAAALLRRLVEADAADFPAWTELGTMNYAMGKSEEAEAAYARALKEKPEFLRAAINLGRLRIAMKKYEPAIEVLTPAVEKNPQSPEANRLLGEAYLATKKYEPAIEALSVAVEKNPQSPDANYLLGDAYLQIKKGSKAVPYLNEAARLGRADAHLKLAWLYNAAGHKDLAAAEYEQYLTKEPKHPEREKMRHYIEENKKP